MNFITSPRFEPGTLVGEHYRLKEFIARGSVSEIYRARAIGSGESVALKILMPPQGHGTPERQIAYFLREAAVTAQVNHPNIVELLEVGYDPHKGHYLVLEYLPGRTLEDLIAEEGPLEEIRAREIVTQVLGALSSAHMQGVVHRDLKPNNVQVVSSDGQRDSIKLLDFGIAKRFDESPMKKALTQVDTLVGTPQWMSPEQCRGQVLDERTDIYSVGALLYYLVTGRAPFIGDQVMQVLNAVLTEPPKPAAKIRKKLMKTALSRTLKKAIDKALQKDPKQRFMDAAHFQAFLDRKTPNVQWTAIPSEVLVRRAPTDAPGVLAVRIPRSQAKTFDLPDALDEILDHIESDAVLSVTHGPGAVSLLFQAGYGQINTANETAATGLRILDGLNEMLPNCPTRLFVTVGDPTLGLFRTAAKGAPLLDHIHDVLRDPARWSGEAVVTKSGYYRQSGLAALATSGLFVPPEWIDELRQEFVIGRVIPGLHGIGKILSFSDPDEEPGISDTAELVLETLCGQHAGLSVTDLEEALFLSIDPVEIMKAIADLQKADLVRIDSSGSAHAQVLVDGSLPTTQVPSVERRLLYLTVFSLMTQRNLGTFDNVERQAENLESGHRVSSVRLWERRAAETKDPSEARRCLYRALRIASTRTPHPRVRPILEALTKNAERRIAKARAARKAG